MLLSIDMAIELCKLIGAGADDVSVADARLLVSLGWITPELRRLTRCNTTPGRCTAVMMAWKRVCASLMPLAIVESSVHRQDLSLTTRSRCYTADTTGHFLPHGGNGGVRCTDSKHYYRHTLHTQWPSDYPDLGRYMTWTLQKLGARNGAAERQRVRLLEEWREHRAQCDVLAAQPWLAAEVSALIEANRSRTLSAKTLERKRKFAMLKFNETN